VQIVFYTPQNSKSENGSCECSVGGAFRKPKLTYIPKKGKSNIIPKGPSPVHHHTYK